MGAVQFSGQKACLAQSSQRSWPLRFQKPRSQKQSALDTVPGSDDDRAGHSRHDGELEGACVPRGHSPQELDADAGAA